MHDFAWAKGVKKILKIKNFKLKIKIISNLKSALTQRKNT